MEFSQKSVKVFDSKISADESKGLGVVTAIFSATNVLDQGGDKIMPGAYTKTLQDRKPKVCWNHSWDAPVGKTLEMEELMPGDNRLPIELKQMGAGALMGTVQFNLNTQRGREAFEEVKFWGQDGEWSIGYTVEAPFGSSTKNLMDGTREIQALALFEVSPVIFGMNRYTGTLALKSLVDVKDPTERMEIAREIKAMLASIEDKPTDVEPVLEQKKAMPYKETGTTDTAWNGPEMWANIHSGNFIALKEGCAWSKDTSSAAKADYKMLHHIINPLGEVGDANLVACLAGINTLKAGGAGIPPEDVQGVYDHLAAHVKDAKMSVPALKSNNNITLQKRETAMAAKAAGHTHNHHHGETVHSHAHTHANLNYGHGGEDMEVTHAHGHEADPEVTSILDAWGTTPEEANMNPDGTPNGSAKALGPIYRLEGKAVRVHVEGSFEDTKNDLNDILDQFFMEMLPDKQIASWVVATYDTYAIVAVCSALSDKDSDDIEYWKLPYSRDTATDTYELGQPAAVDVVGVANVMPDTWHGVTFDFAKKSQLIKEGLSTKNSTRNRRRYLLLAHAGIDINGSGITPADLVGASGVGYIPAEGDSSYRDDVTDTSPEGIGPQGFNNNPLLTADSQLGDQTSPAIVQWLQGTYYLDNAGNLTTTPVSNNLLGPLGTGVASPIASQGSYLDNVGVIPDQLVSGPSRAQIAATLSGQAGSLTLPKSAGYNLEEKKPKIRNRVLGLIKLRQAGMTSPLFRDNGGGSQGSSAWTSSPASGTTSDEVAALGAMSAYGDDIIAKALGVAIAVKEGRMLSADNSDKIRMAHAALTAILAQAGVDPLDSDDAYPNTISGEDEDGVPIEEEVTQASTNSSPSLDEGKAFADDLIMFQALKAQERR